jgi:hypothetical protein
MMGRIARAVVARSRYGYRITLGRVAAAVRARAEPRLSVRRWERDGRPAPPPPEVKRRALRDAVRRYGLRTFVETGTFLGDTSAAMRTHVDQVITIELSADLAERARRRFEGVANVRVLEGDSGRLLPQLVEELREPALFWLDGHYSAGITARGDEDTPVRSELRAILDHPVDGHVILIDDARDFQGGAYPTVDEIRKLANAHRAGYELEVRDDIIRLTPAR